MSLFDILEGRMQQIFEGGSSMAPLPFKKLAKQAVREMKRGSAKMDGRTFAPSLYTVLVNPADDAAIAPLYQQVTDELVDFVAHEAQNGNYALLANPMVRFIADPNVRQGKMEVVAEVVTPEVLDALRVEETAYAQNHAQLGRNRGGAGGQRPVAQGRQPMPGRPAGPAPQQAVAPGTPVGNLRRAPVGTPAPAAAPVAAAAAVAAGAALPTSRPAPAPRRRPEPAGNATCELVDPSSGRTWRIGVPSTVIGRDEATADLVLNDTNISRRHAELKCAGGTWVLADLGSTNGTRVNGQRITQATLADGDTLALGLITLEFREL